MLLALLLGADVFASLSGGSVHIAHEVVVTAVAEDFSAVAGECDGGAVVVDAALRGRAGASAAEAVPEPPEAGPALRYAVESGLDPPAAGEPEPEPTDLAELGVLRV